MALYLIVCGNLNSELSPCAAFSFFSFRQLQEGLHAKAPISKGEKFNSIFGSYISLRLCVKPMLPKFDYSLDYKNLNFRTNPELYKIGKGEQGVLLVEPYKSEILPHWKFATPALAEKSSKAIYKMFIEYKKQNDFVGMDMARKFLQMGYTRSRRYANHKSGQKYDGPVPKDKKGVSGSHGREIRPIDLDPEKAKSAEVFYKVWQKVKLDKEYNDLRKTFIQKYYT